MKKIKAFFKKYWLYPLGGIVGGVLGYVYWLNWACDTGCPLTATPTRTIIYGVIMGALIFSMFVKNNEKETVE